MLNVNLVQSNSNYDLFCSLVGNFTVKILTFSTEITTCLAHFWDSFLSSLRYFALDTILEGAGFGPLQIPLLCLNTGKTLPFKKLLFCSGGKICVLSIDAFCICCRRKAGDSRESY